MAPSKIRLALGVSSSIFLIITLFVINSVFKSEQSRTAYSAFTFPSVISISLILFFTWVGLGRIAGSIASFISIIFIFFLFRNYIQEPFFYYLLPFAISIFIGYRFSEKFTALNRDSRVEIEKIEEEINLLNNRFDRNKKELDHLDRRLTRFSNLSEIVKEFSSTLSKEDVIKIIVENAYKIIGKADRVLFFIVDITKQELGLAFSKKIGSISHIKLKNGDIFDRWVFKKRQPLLVEDINTDFRFSLEGEKIDEGFSSIISAPLVSEDRVLGILRMDSPKKSIYTQEDLRLLDIITDLALVVLENAMLYRKLSDLAITDGLTSLYVHKHFMERLANEVKRALKNKTPFSLIMLDIDDFKDFNDKYGHTAGDLVLKHIAKVINKDLSGGDIAARYGGEEFALILLNKKKKDAITVAENLRKKIEETPIILRREKTNITVSIGISACPEDSTLTEDLIRDADRRLYKAKEKGKNQVCSH